MPLDVTFTLSDQDLERFQAIVDKAQTAMEDEHNAAEIKAAASTLIEQAKAPNLPDFVSDCLGKVETVINMLGDDEWQLSDDEKRSILGALAYFCDPEDLIPDHIPGLGFLDDAIYLQMVMDELKGEIEAYEEFCEFRSAEEKKREVEGLNPQAEREEWLKDQRSALHLRMRSRRMRRRMSPKSTGGWRIGLW